VCHIAALKCAKVADLVLALDQSASIVGQKAGGMKNWNLRVLDFARKIAGAFTIGQTETQVGVLKFNQTVDIVFNLNRYSDRASLLDAIGKIPIYGGDTNIAIALRTARESMFIPSSGSRSNVAKVLILLTDGTANFEETNTVTEATQTKDAGIKILTVGVTSEVKEEQLKEIASDRSYYFYAADFDQLNNILHDVVETSCTVVETGGRI